MACALSLYICLLASPFRGKGIALPHRSFAFLPQQGGSYVHCLPLWPTSLDGFVACPEWPSTSNDFLANMAINSRLARAMVAISAV